MNWVGETICTKPTFVPRGKVARSFSIRGPNSKRGALSTSPSSPSSPTNRMACGTSTFRERESNNNTRPIRRYVIYIYIYILYGVIMV